jgi:hypothetical protein
MWCRREPSRPRAVTSQRVSYRVPVAEVIGETKQTCWLEIAHNEVLEDEDLADGYVVACQSVALSAEVSVSYD